MDIRRVASSTSYSVLEAIFGRQLMWRASRSYYLLARRDGSIRSFTDGELLVVKSVANWSASKAQAMVVFDVGANLGLWTGMLAEAITSAGAPKAKVYQFEPAPHLIPALTKTSQTGVPGVEIELAQLALSNKAGKMSFIITGEATGTNHLVGEDNNDEGSTTEVEVSTVDEYCVAHKIDHIDLLKIDAEGFDIFVIAGAKRMLEEERISIVQFEYGDLYVRTRSYLLDAFKLVKGTRYKVGRVSNRGIELFSEWDGDLERFYSANYVIVHESARERLPVRDVQYERNHTYK